MEHLLLEQSNKHNLYLYYCSSIFYFDGGVDYFKVLLIFVVIKALTKMNHGFILVGLTMLFGRIDI